MSMLFLLIFMGPISLVYHPHVMVHGVCIAEPGSFNALWCPAPAPPAPKVRVKREKVGPRKREYPNTNERRAYMREYMAKYRAKDR